MMIKIGHSDRTYYIGQILEVVVPPVLIWHSDHSPSPQYLEPGDKVVVVDYRQNHICLLVSFWGRRGIVYSGSLAGMRIVVPAKLECE